MSPAGSSVLQPAALVNLTGDDRSSICTDPTQ
jgi:hypothetical protein